MEKITVKTPSTSGEIYVGEGVLESRLPHLTKGVKTFVLTDRNVYRLYKDLIVRSFSGGDIFLVDAGEESKNFQTLQEVLEGMEWAGMRRTSRLFAFGGGVIGDMGGLAAALYMRGVSYVQIPTTLLAQVDSSVGGKTAVDLNGVKNLVGAFYQPCEVLVEPAFLDTLPEREIKCGLGEIVKYAALNEGIFDRLSAQDDWQDKAFLTGLIADCIRHKAGVVERDEKESGERKSLNVGHTTGHAIELAMGLSHGESVLYGMLLETKIAIAKGICEKEYGEKLLALIAKGLSLAPTAEVDFSKVEEYAVLARSDKKNGEDGNIQMAVAKGKGEWTMLSLPFKEYQAALAQSVNV